ncbi:MAG TPA: RluA family pseudouridine synthase, partial [Defluviitaleaceae bacterium]|nr:RluA family pseudouridine synthase [Defluviitaleaceae bacterium]
NDYAHNELSLQLKKYSVVRKYIAIVYNNIIDDFGTVDAPVGRHPKDRKKMTVINKNSKKAITHFTVLERFGDFTLIEASLVTGRTHQIRVHMKYLGHPILGDYTYGPKKQPFKLNGQMLHARFLAFNHPSTKEYMEFKTPVPEYFEDVINILRKKNQK